MFASAFPVTPRSSLPLDIQSPAPPLAGFSRLAWLWVPHTAIPCWKTVVSPTPIYTATPINYPCINLVLCYNVDGSKEAWPQGVRLFPKLACNKARTRYLLDCAPNSPRRQLLCNAHLRVCSKIKDLRPLYNPRTYQPVSPKSFTIRTYAKIKIFSS